MTGEITAESRRWERCAKIGSLARRIQHLAWLGDKASVNELNTRRNNVELCEALWALAETVGELAGRIEHIAEAAEYDREDCHGTGA